MSRTSQAGLPSLGTDDGGLEGFEFRAEGGQQAGREVGRPAGQAARQRDRNR